VLSFRTENLGNLRFFSLEAGKLVDYIGLYINKFLRVPY